MTHLTCAVILAAGSGQRLKAMLPDKPKGFIELDGLPIIERSIRQLKQAGIDEIIIVTGYAAGYYEALAQRCPELRLVNNAAYDSTGTLHSLYCARALVRRRDFLLLESDLIYEDRALSRLIAFHEPDAILTSGFTHATDEVYVSAQAGRVVKLSKQRAELDQVVGEEIGISKFSSGVYEALCHYAEETFQSRPDLSYEDGINGIASAIPIFCCHVEDLIWSEIDTPFHLERVKRDILPRL
jgi:2-aminoethylphosphonate-pyruvate transaminase